MEKYTYAWKNTHIIKFLVIVLKVKNMQANHRGIDLLLEAIRFHEETDRNKSLGFNKHGRVNQSTNKNNPRNNSVVFVKASYVQPVKTVPNGCTIMQALPLYKVEAGEKLKFRPWSKSESEACVFYMRQFNDFGMVAKALGNRNHDEVRFFFSTT